MPKNSATPLTKSTATSFPVLATLVIASTPYRCACKLRALHIQRRSGSCQGRILKQPYDHTCRTRHLHQVQLLGRYFGSHALAGPIDDYSIPANPAERDTNLAWDHYRRLLGSGDRSLADNLCIAKGGSLGRYCCATQRPVRWGSVITYSRASCAMYV